MPETKEKSAESIRMSVSDILKMLANSNNQNTFPLKDFAPITKKTNKLILQNLVIDSYLRKLFQEAKINFSNTIENLKKNYDNLKQAEIEAIMSFLETAEKSEYDLSKSGARLFFDVYQHIESESCHDILLLLEKLKENNKELKTLLNTIKTTFKDFLESLKQKDSPPSPPRAPET